ncbi:hypothetical protein ACWFNS_18290 [Oerskovia enterophila]
MSRERQPGLDEIEARLVGLLDGSVTRDEADRWAGRWYTDDSLDWDDDSLWALEELFGIDLQQTDEHGTPVGYLRPDDSVAELLDELRRRRGDRACRAGSAEK